MDAATLNPAVSAGLAVVLLALGAGATFLIGWLIPEETFATAQPHGRFAGLETEATDENGGRRRRKPRTLRLPTVPGRLLDHLMPQPVPVRA